MFHALRQFSVSLMLNETFACMMYIYFKAIAGQKGKNFNI